MEWYNILFLIVLTIFLLKTILTWIFGDIDIDFDADGDIDFDISSMLSFKGILHFLLGFSTYLAATAKFYKTYDTICTYQFTLLHYCIGILSGILFTVVLWYLYKFMMKFNHYNEEEFDINSYNSVVLTSNGKIDHDTYSYTVLVHTPVGSKKVIVLSLDSDIKIGSERKIYMNEQGIYCI